MFIILHHIRSFVSWCMELDMRNFEVDHKCTFWIIDSFTVRANHDKYAYNHLNISGDV